MQHNLLTHLFSYVGPVDVIMCLLYVWRNVTPSIFTLINFFKKKEGLSYVNWYICFTRQKYKQPLERIP